MSIPSISALLVLDALARTGSVKATAEEVNLSQSAVSHKLKALEAKLGFELTQVKGRGIILTGEARRYVAAIRPALSILKEAHSGLDQARGSLEVAVASGLATTWLAPRLSDFLGKFPEVSLTLRSVAAGEDMPNCDLGIVFTDNPPEGARHLFDLTFFPVCSPEFLDRQLTLTSADVSPDMMLHLKTRADWAQWIELYGATQNIESKGVMFTGLLTMYAAAEAGLGLCLADAITSEHSIRAGRLVRPFSNEIPARASYWITPSPGGFTAPAAAFAEWLQNAFLSNS